MAIGVAALFVLCLLVAWLSTIFGLPGNWLILIIAIIYWVFAPMETRYSIGAPLLFALAGLAFAGEIIEFIAGSAGVSKAGGSRRSALYAIAGSMCGAIAGLFVGIPIPIVGPILGALLFGSIGAMVGAILGERSIGRDWKRTIEVGKGAFWGRTLGTFAKLAVGLLMIAVATAGVAII